MHLQGSGSSGVFVPASVKPPLSWLASLPATNIDVILRPTSMNATVGPSLKAQPSSHHRGTVSKSHNAIGSWNLMKAWPYDLWGKIFPLLSWTISCLGFQNRRVDSKSSKTLLKSLRTFRLAALKEDLILIHKTFHQDLEVFQKPTREGKKSTNAHRGKQLISSLPAASYRCRQGSNYLCGWISGLHVLDLYLRPTRSAQSMSVAMIFLVVVNHRVYPVVGCHDSFTVVLAFLKMDDDREKPICPLRTLWSAARPEQKMHLESWFSRL